MAWTGFSSHSDVLHDLLHLFLPYIPLKGNAVSFRYYSVPRTLMYEQKALLTAFFELRE